MVLFVAPVAILGVPLARRIMMRCSNCGDEVESVLALRMGDAVLCRPCRFYFVYRVPRPEGRASRAGSEARSREVKK